MLRLKEWPRKINIDGEIARGRLLAGQTTFGVGGPADLFARPAHTDDLIVLVAAAERAGLPWFALGGGSNILVSDRGVRGLVIDLSALDGTRLEGTTLTVGAGLPMSDAAAAAAEHGLGGLDFIYAMPGSVGGAVWMNARCYDGEIYNVLEEVEYVSEDGTLMSYRPKPEDFGYKRSPFMEWPVAMTRVRFRLHPADPEGLWKKMHAHETDRRAKGHFAAPCAGSVFKNNRAFGRPSGVIIDSLGLRGFRIGDAQVSPQHANIVINLGNATAGDIRRVIEHVQNEVARRLGYELEREVLYVGDWDRWEEA